MVSVTRSRNRPPASTEPVVVTQLAMVADQDQLPARFVDRVNQAGQVPGRDHARLVEDHDLAGSQPMRRARVALGVLEEELGQSVGAQPRLSGQHPGRHRGHGQAPHRVAGELPRSPGGPHSPALARASRADHALDRIPATGDSPDDPDLILGQAGVGQDGGDRGWEGDTHTRISAPGHSVEDVTFQAQDLAGRVAGPAMALHGRLAVRPDHGGWRLGGGGQRQADDLGAGQRGVDHRLYSFYHAGIDLCLGVETAGHGLGGVRPGPRGAPLGQFPHHLGGDLCRVVAIQRQPPGDPTHYLRQPPFGAEADAGSLGLPPGYQRVVLDTGAVLGRPGLIGGGLVLPGQLVMSERPAQILLQLRHPGGAGGLDLAAAGGEVLAQESGDSDDLGLSVGVRRCAGDTEPVGQLDPQRCLVHASGRLLAAVQLTGVDRAPLPIRATNPVGDEDMSVELRILSVRGPMYVRGGDEPVGVDLQHAGLALPGERGMALQIPQGRLHRGDMSGAHLGRYCGPAHRPQGRHRLGRRECDAEPAAGLAVGEALMWTAELLAGDRMAGLLEQPAELLPVHPPREADRRRARPHPLSRCLTAARAIVVQAASDFPLRVLPPVGAEGDQAHHGRRPPRAPQGAEVSIACRAIRPL